MIADSVRAIFPYDWFDSVDKRDYLTLPVHSEFSVFSNNLTFQMKPMLLSGNMGCAKNDYPQRFIEIVQYIDFEPFVEGVQEMYSFHRCYFHGYGAGGERELKQI